MNWKRKYMYEKNKPEVKQTNNNSNKIHSLIANIIL